MREILFRGKPMCNDDWIYGSIVHQTDYYGEPVERWYIIDGTDTQDYDIGPECRVKPDTVSQYTGLKDKHGNKIFEDDKLHFAEPAEGIDGIMTVLWYNNGWCVQEDGCYPDHLDDGDTDDMEIVGNVWEG